MSDNHDRAVAVITRGETHAMAPIVQAAMAVLANNPDPATLRELLAVQREWEAGEAKKAYHVALADLKRDLPSVIAHDKTVDFSSAKGRTHYTHTTMAGVMEAIQEPLVRHGFALNWRVSNGPGGVTVTCVLRHLAGHAEDGATLTAAPDDSGNKNPVQRIGSTQTYLQRYTALATLGLATADQPDADDAPAPSLDRVDTERTMRAVAAIRKAGRTVQQAETYLGAARVEWTVGDLDKLKAWLSEEASPASKAGDAAEGAPSPAASAEPPDTLDLIGEITQAKTLEELTAIGDRLAKSPPKGPGAPAVRDAYSRRAAGLKAAVREPGADG